MEKQEFRPSYPLWVWTVGGVYMPFYSAWKICIFAGLDSFSADNGGKVIVCLYYYS